MYLQRTLKLAPSYSCLVSKYRPIPTNFTVFLLLIICSVAYLEEAPLPPLGNGLTPSLTVMLTNALNFDRSTVKHGTQNIQNDCNFSSDSFRVHQIHIRPGRTPLRELTAPQGPLAALKGPTSKGEELGGGREEGEMKGTRGTAPFRTFLDPLLTHVLAIQNCADTLK